MSKISKFSFVMLTALIMIFTLRDSVSASEHSRCRSSSSFSFNINLGLGNLLWNALCDDDCDDWDDYVDCNLGWRYDHNPRPRAIVRERPVYYAQPVVVRRPVYYEDVHVVPGYRCRVW